jgi:hypothetical protein
MPDLSKGDFLHQADQELFLVCIDESEDSYTFAVHGWREIGKERLDEYLDHKSGKLFDGEELAQIVEDEGDDEDIENFEQFLELVSAYKDTDVDADQMIDKYALKDK